ncbi:MAG: hypothetical protein AB7O62_09950 [Pirellulales bacterium]
MHLLFGGCKLRGAWFLGGCLVAVGAALLWTASASRAERGGRLESADEPPVRAETANTRLREGTRLVNVTGYFKLTGDGITFYLDGGERRLQALENLNLERIAAVVVETPDPLDWNITGTITEYGGANYLLVTQAALKSRRGNATRD